MSQPTDIEVNASLHSNRATAGWIMDGARFHVWFDIKTKELDHERILYKNPLRDIDYKHPGYFRTRHLQADLPKNAEIVKHVFSEIERRDLLAVALAVEEEKARQKSAENAEYMRKERIKEAALELFDALKVIRNNLGLSREECRDIAAAAIAKTIE